MRTDLISSLVARRMVPPSPATTPTHAPVTETAVVDIAQWCESVRSVHSRDMSLTIDFGKPAKAPGYIAMVTDVKAILKEHGLSVIGTSTGHRKGFSWNPDTIPYGRPWTDDSRTLCTLFIDTAKMPPRAYRTALAVYPADVLSKVKEDIVTRVKAQKQVDTPAADY